MARYTKKDADGRYYIESVNGKLESDKFGHTYGEAIDRFAELENADVAPRAELDRVARELERVEALYFAKDTQLENAKAEVARLIKANNRDDLQHKYCNLIEDVLVYSKSLEDYNKFRKSFKAEAIKEFAERLKSDLGRIPQHQFTRS